MRGWHKIEIHARRQKKVQKYQCKDCRHWFSFSPKTFKGFRYSKNSIFNAIKKIVVSRNSLSIANEDLGISKPSLVHWLNLLGENAFTPMQLARKLKPCWKGILGVDGFWFKMAGEKRAGLIAQDLKTRDVPNWEYAEGETSLDYKILFLTLQEMNYPFRGVVSDRNAQIIRWRKRLLPEIPHQYCCIHFLRDVGTKLHYVSIRSKLRGKSKEQKNIILQEFGDVLRFRKKIHAILFARTEKMARYRLKLLVEHGRWLNSTMKSFVADLLKEADHYLIHFSVPGLPRTNNIAELTIKHIRKRLKLIEGFQSDETAENFLKLFIHSLRMRKVTSAKKKHQMLNYKAPLQNAVPELSIRDWLRFCQRR